MASIATRNPAAPTLTTASPIVIVGAGAFGLSTAFHLLERGYTHVTVLDRAKRLPAVDAASTDINKVVRSCYSDIFYARLAREALEAWRQPMWQGCYHQCGVINVGGTHFDDRLRENDRQVGAPIQDLPDAKAIRTKLWSTLGRFTDDFGTPDPDSDARIGPFTDYTGHFNPEGGWTEAARAVEILLSRVRAMGGRVIEDQEIAGLVRDGSGHTTGVEGKDGAYFQGDRVILTTGAWTASTFPELQLDSKCLAAGQSVGMIQLSLEERERYKGTCVYLDFDSGLYVLPAAVTLLRKLAAVFEFLPEQCPFHAVKDGIIKLGINTAGHTHLISTPQIGGDINGGLARMISTPRTIISHPDRGDGLRVPRLALQALRDAFRKVYPELAARPWYATRMCWYTDSPDGDWVIGPFPGDPALFLATSGSGHAFKFLPNVGSLVVDALEGRFDPATAARFAVDRDVRGASNGRASNVTVELDEAELCGPEEGA